VHYQSPYLDQPNGVTNDMFTAGV